MCYGSKGSTSPNEIIVSFIYCLVLIFALSPFDILIYMF